MTPPRPFVPPHHVAANPPASRPGTPPIDTEIPGIRMAAHIQNEGDMAFEPGQGAGAQGSKRRLEAVALYAEGINLHELEYAGVSYDGRLLPWVCPPQFTGTRGLGAPLLGFAARLSGGAAARYDVVYSGSFFSAGAVGPVHNGEFLKSTAAGDPLEQLLIWLEPKQ